MLAFSQWRELHGAGELNEVQSHFFNPKPVELLFDVEADPHEVVNLAGRSDYQLVLEDLRDRLQKKMKSIHDLSLFPESQMIDLALENGIAFGEKRSGEIGNLLDVVDIALLPWEQARKKLPRALKSNNPRIRYWGVTACAAFGEKVEPMLPVLRDLLEDTDPQVQIRTAEVLGILRAVEPQQTLYDVLANSDSNAVAAAAMNAIVFLRDHHDYKFNVDASMIKASEEPLVQRRLEYLNSVN